MKRVLFITNYAAPYRVRFFDELGKDLDVTVLFSDRKEDVAHRNAAWFVPGEGGFRQVSLEKRTRIGGKEVCRDVIAWIKKGYDAIVVCGYSTPTVMLAIGYMRLHKIPFYMEVDGGLIRPDSGMKYRFKKLLVGSASWWISSGDSTTRYLTHYGAAEEKIFFYPFSSLKEEDILSRPVSAEEKASLREELGIREKKVVLAIGQFIHRKGFDVLLHAAAALAPDTAVYIVGGEPGEEHVQLRRQLGLKAVYFPGFMKKEELVRFYKAADVFVLPTREDIWGLVINEAMAYGLPVITTDKCVAGLELVQEGVNGYLVPTEDPEALAQKIKAVLADDTEAMGRVSLEKIRPYTIENMARAHVDIFCNGR